MAHFVMFNTQVLYDGIDLSGHSNAVAFELTAEDVDDNVFGGSSHKRLAGLKEAQITGSGYLDYTDDGQDERIAVSEFAAADRLVTIAGQSGDENNVAYSFENLLSSYQMLGEHGSNAPFSISGSTSGRFFRGTILHDTATARTATGNGTARNLGAVSSTQKLYASLHVITTGTGTLDVKVQSDDAQGFGTPVDRITFSQANAIGAQFATPVSGAITDTWWRVTWTIAGASPSFKFLATVGII